MNYAPRKNQPNATTSLCAFSFARIWFMSELTGEVWLPLIVGMQRYPRYGSWFKTGDKVKVQMNGNANINRHSIELFPDCIVSYLKKDTETRFSTAGGYVYDIRSEPRGLIGRIIINFSWIFFIIKTE